MRLCLAQGLHRLSQHVEAARQARQALRAASVKATPCGRR
jgi:hypothetical protein